MTASTSSRSTPASRSEVWIIDICGHRLDRDPAAGRYTQQVQMTDLSRVGIAALPDLSLDLSGLF